MTLLISSIITSLKQEGVAVGMDHSHLVKDQEFVDSICIMEKRQSIANPGVGTPIGRTVQCDHLHVRHRLVEA